MKRRFSEIRRFIPFVLFLGLCLTLLILHGLNKFLVDNVTIALLLLLAIPIIGEFIESVKLSGNEIVFKEGNTSDKVFTFLESISGEDGWTFYPPREAKLLRI